MRKWWVLLLTAALAFSSSLFHKQDPAGSYISLEWKLAGSRLKGLPGVETATANIFAGSLGFGLDVDQADRSLVICLLVQVEPATDQPSLEGKNFKGAL